MASSTDDSQLIVVTGATGFIATHIIKQLQEDGRRVRGTVRSLQNKKKNKHLKNLCPDAKLKLELVEADLLAPDSWEHAIKDATYVIHAASPTPTSTPDDENEIIQPAVEGTRTVLRACVKAKSVKRIVMTSSIAAINFHNVDSKKLLTEDDWTDIEHAEPYRKSKALAEKAAWDFVEALPVEDKIELAVINPTYVTGPMLHGTWSLSMEIPKRLLERTMPAIPKLFFNVVDVRDVALAHIEALFIPEAAGHRHILGHEDMWISDMAKIYAEEFDPQGYNVPTVVCPYFILWLNSFFDKTLKMILPWIGNKFRLDNTRMRTVLGIEPTNAKDSLLDMAYTMIEGGFIKKTPKYKGRNLNTEGERSGPEQREVDEKK